jgi:uncharacterized membrane protein YeiH
MEVAELTGTVVFAVSGVLAVAGRRLDWFGAIVVGVVTALGGGSIRDVILGDTPVFWTEQLEFLFTAALGAAVAIPLAYLLVRGSTRRFDEALQLADAAGLALFAVVGANTALELGFDGAIAVVAGTLTGVGGGVIRDVLAGRVPLVLSGEIYATAALAGTTAFVLLDELTGLPEPPAAVIGAVIIFGLRVLGIQRQWSLPALAAPDEDGR